MTERKNRVVVVGGGYAGVIAANHLRLRPDVDVTLVNPRAEFVERIRLHQLVAGSDDAVVDYAEILGPGIELVIDAATRIDSATRHVELFSGAPLPYDYLIYAVGSGSGGATVDGADEFAYPSADLEEAKRLSLALDELHYGAPVCVVGAGPTGIETAAELAEQGRAVTLVCGPVLGPYLSTPGRRSVAKRLRKLGVDDRRRPRVGRHRGRGRRRGALRRQAAAELRDDLDRGVRRAGSGVAFRAAHRRDRPAADRRDADEHRRRADRGGRRRRRTVG